MQAIITRYLGATNSRGARVKAKIKSDSVTLPWDHAKDVDENHNAAAQALALKLDWHGNWARGSLPDGTGNVYICIRGPGFAAFKVENVDPC